MGGPGAESPDAGKFSKICKNLLKKNAKMHYFSLFYTKMYKLFKSNVSHGWPKNTTSWEIFEKFLKILDENSIEN